MTGEHEKLRVVAKYEFMKHLRRKRFYVVLALAIAVELIVLIALPLLGAGYPSNVMVMAALLSMGATFPTMGAVFFAGDAIAGEFEGKTGYVLFPNPVRRATIVLGKYLACFSAIALAVLALYGVVGVSLLWIYGRVPMEVAGSMALCLLASGAVVSVTFFFSSISRGTMGATVTTLIFIFVVLEVVESVLLMAGQPRWFLLSYASGVMITIYDGYGAFAGVHEGIPPRAMQSPEVGTSIAVMVAYLLVFLALSVAIAKRREMV
ncbi:MAG: ABC transporter permease [Hadesarchaea archaeon]|nr:ABC transporter permease [Hadesarchaea archaeon]